MNSYRVEYGTDALIFRQNEAIVEERSCSGDDYDRFRQWIDTYNKALEELHNRKAFLETGKELYTWLDEKGFLKNALEHQRS